MVESADLINIGPAEQRKRRIVGLAGIVMASAFLIWLARSHAVRWWRVGTFPMLWMGTLGFLQAHAKTCVLFAARGVCVDARGRSMLNATDRLILAARGRTIVRRATIIAVIATLIALALP